MLENTSELMFAPVGYFVSSSFDENPVLDESRIEELVSMGRKMLWRNMQLVPIKVQAYKDDLIIHRGHHRVYAANELKMDLIPYILETDAENMFREETLEGRYFTPVIEMGLVSREEYLHETNERPPGF